MNATTCESLSGADRLILAGDVNVGQGIHPHTIDIQPGTVSNRFDIQHSKKVNTVLDHDWSIISFVQRWAALEKD